VKSQVKNRSPRSEKSVTCKRVGSGFTTTIIFRRLLKGTLGAVAEGSAERRGVKQKNQDLIRSGPARNLPKIDT